MADDSNAKPSEAWWKWVGDDAPGNDILHTGIRARMVALGERQETEMREALRRHLQEIIDG